MVDDTKFDFTNTDNNNLYKEIEPCLQGITTDMLDVLDEEEVMGLGGNDSRKRVLLKLFYNKLIQNPNIITQKETNTESDVESEIFSLTKYFNSIEKQSLLKMTDGTLISCKFSKLPNFKTNRIPLDVYLRSIPKDSAVVYHTVDLSNNNLLDDDLEYIFEFVSSHKTNLLNLTNNRMSCSSIESIELLWKICDLVNVLILTGSSVAGSDSLYFFKQLNIERAQKIIWIPTVCIPDDRLFKKVLPNANPELLSIIKSIHNQYKKFS
jgi:hypothetical protein